MRVQHTRLLPYLVTAAAASAILACDRQTDTLAAAADPESVQAGFVTSRPEQAHVLLPQASLKPIITVGDQIPGQESNPDPEQRVWAPIPDGLGAFQSDRGQFTLLMNHEINPTATPPNPGIVRKHGSNGAFVSRWIIDRQTLRVLKGEDLTPSSDKVHLWDPSISLLRTHRPYDAVAPALFSGFAAQERSLR